MYIQLLLVIQLTSVLSVPAPKLNLIRKSVVPLIRNSIQSTSNTIQSKLKAQEEVEQEQVKVEEKKETNPLTSITTCPKGEKLVALQNENAKISYQCQKVEEENIPCSSNSILQAKRNKEGLIEYNCIQLNSINQDSNLCPMGMVLTAFQNGYRCVGYNSREIDSSSVQSKQVYLNDQGEVIPKCNETSVLTRTESGLNCTPLNDKKVEEKVGKKSSNNEDNEKKKSNESKKTSSNKDGDENEDEDEDEDNKNNDKEDVKKDVTKPKKDLNQENLISKSESKSQLKTKPNITSKDTKSESKLIKPKPSNSSKYNEDNEENEENEEENEKVRKANLNEGLPFKVKITHPKVQILNNDLDEGMIRKTTLITKKWVA